MNPSLSESISALNTKFGHFSHGSVKHSYSKTILIAKFEDAILVGLEFRINPAAVIEIVDKKPESLILELWFFIKKHAP